MTQENSTKFFQGIYERPEYTVGGVTPLNYAIPVGSGIYDDDINKLLIFPVAGYTKSVTAHKGGMPWETTPVGMALMKQEGENRQNIIKALMTQTGVVLNERIGIRQGCDPTVKIKLVPEPHNPYDPNAILVMAYHGNTTFPIGYVPSKIAAILTQRRDWFVEENFLLIFRLDDKNKHIIPQLIVAYQEPEAEKSRFSKIEYE